MTALSIGIKDQEPIIGWAALQPGRVIPCKYELELASQLWKAHDALTEEGLAQGAFDYERLTEMSQTAFELWQIAVGDIEACHCFLPEHSCDACAATARARYILQQVEG